MSQHVSCENCIRPIEYLPEIGWLHAEHPRYAHEPLGCGVAAPAELACPVCLAVCTRDNHRRVMRHLPPDGVSGEPWCEGSWQPGVDIRRALGATGE